MKIRFALLCALALPALRVAAQVPATVNITTPTACITAADGTPLASGTLTVFAPGQTGQPAPFTSSTGVVMAGTVTRAIANGQISSALTLPNPAVTSPVNIGYTFTIHNPGAPSSTFANVAITPDGSGNWSLCSLQAGTYQTAFPTVYFSNGTFGGGTVAGATTFQSTVTLHADPTANLQAATKQYVDNHASPFTGGTVANPTTFSSTVTLSADPTLNLQAATKQYVDNHAGATQVNADWNATSGLAQILNKPTIPAAQVNADWNAASGLAQILNKPTLGTAAAQNTSAFDAVGTSAAETTRAEAAEALLTPPPQNRAAGSLTLGQAPDSMLGDRHVFNLRFASGEFDCATGCSTSPAAAANCPNDTCTGTQYAARLLINGPYTSFIARAKLRANVTGDISAFAGVTAAPAYYGAYISGSNFVWNYSGGGPVTGPALTTGNYYRVWTMVNNGFASVGYCPSPSPSMAGCYDNVIDTTAAPPIVTVQEQTSGTGTVSSAKFAADNISGSSPLLPNMIPVTAPGEAGNAPLPNLTYVPSNPAGSNVKLRVILPSNFDPAATNPWVMWIQGDGGVGADIYNIAVDTQMADGLLQAGYAIVVTDFTSPSDWGNPPSGLDVAEALAQARLQFNLDPIPYCYAGSMGGIRVLNAIAHGQLKCRAIEMAFPVYSLSSIYQGGSGSPSFVSQIQTAYGFSSPSGYAAATSGYDPALDPISDFSSTPVDIHCSAGDTTVPCSSNGQALATAITGAGGTAVFTSCNGTHGDISCVLPASAVDWFKKH